LKGAILLFCLVLLATLGSAITEGGNITSVNVSPVSNQSVWHGVYGQTSISPPVPVTINATPGNLTGITMNTGSYSCTSGVSILNILFSNSSSAITSLSPGNISQLDDFISAELQDASGTFTFSSTFETAGYGNISNVPSTYTEPQSSQAFRLGYLQDQSGNFVFITPAVEDQAGFNGTPLDYQAMLPTNGTQIPYHVGIDLQCTSAPPGPGPSPGPGGGGSTGGGGGGESAYGFSTWSVDIYVDIGRGIICKVNARRSITVTENYTILANTLTNLGGENCTLLDFVFIDVIPYEFAPIDDIEFSPPYFSAKAATVIYIFPVFSPGESKVITYTVRKQVPVSKLDDFDVMRLLASKLDDTNYTNKVWKPAEEPEAWQLPGGCQPEIYCADWGECIGGYKERKCIDIMKCYHESFIQVEKCKEPEPAKDYANLCISAALLVIAAAIILLWEKKKRPVPMGGIRRRKMPIHKRAHIKKRARRHRGK